MAATAPARFGENLGTGDARALFLKVFSGEVLLAFERKSITNGRVRTRTISSGKSAQFPLIGSASSSYHTPGNNIIEDGSDLSDPQLSEKIITIDGIHQSSVLIPTIDEAMSHYDVRGPFAREMGWKLAQNFDVRTLMTIFKGSETTATLTADSIDSSWGATGTKQITDPDFHTNAASAVGTIQTIAQTMDEHDVPEDGRYICVDPQTYHNLAD